MGIEMIWLLVAFAVAEERPTKLPKSYVRGKQLYEQYCFQCHGPLALAENELAQSMKAPPLAGRISKKEYPEAIDLIQKGQGIMPSYEMTLDKHDTKRILMYLSRLDQETGLDPDPKAYEEEEKKKEEKKNSKQKSKKKIGPNLKEPKSIANPKMLGPRIPKAKETEKEKDEK